MTYEKSCGAIVYRKYHGNTEILLIKHINSGHWSFPKGHVENDETEPETAIREIKEETGLDIKPIYRGIVTFCSNIYESQQMHLFTCKEYSGTLSLCSEGELKWVKRSELENIPLWEGDLIFLRLLENDNPFFSLKLIYENDTLVKYEIKNASI